MSAYGEQPQLLWKPPQDGRFSRVEYFRHFVNRKRGINLNNYHDLHQFSVERWDFWQDLWEFLGVVYSVPPTKIIIDRPQKEGPEFFPGARLNYAENQLRWNDDGVVITAAREVGSVEHYTHKQLRALVRDMGNAMRAHGVRPGDRIAAIITNSIHAQVVALAAASVGALFSSTAPDMGASGILDRYRQVTPKLLFADTEVLYAGKRIDVTPKIAQVAEDLSRRYGLEKTVLIPSTISGSYPNTSVSHGITLDKFLAAGEGGELVFEQLPFDHPLWILFSSGTSGPPKCIVHSAGGSMLQGWKEWSFGLDLSRDDCILQYTTTSWMVFNAVVSSLAVGCRTILFDGSPFHPDPRSLLKLASEQRVSMLGLSPRYFAEIQGLSIKPQEVASFDSLRTIFVTGSVFSAPMFHWIYEAFPSDVRLVSGSGGTDVCTNFVTGVSTLPVHAGEIQGRSLGMKVEVFDPAGRNIEGMPGELVCTRAHPSLPLYFWNDPGKKKYQAAYFSTYPDIWTQGDFIVVNPVTKGLKILGRSDGVLNPSGVRFGSAEVYGVLERFKGELEDALCVGQRRARDTDERVLLFVKMRKGRSLTRKFEAQIRRALRTSLSKRHEPSYVFEVEDIPYTVNNKKIEIAVKQIVSGSTLKPSGTVANPEAFEHYYKYVELEKLVGDTTRKTRVRGKL